MAVFHYRRLAGTTYWQIISAPNRNIGITTDQASALPPRPIGARQESRDRIHHAKERILLNALVTADFPVIENRIFENCDIIGPSVILPKPARFEGRTQFRGANNVEDCLIEIPSDIKLLSGVIEVRNCAFIDCAFVAVSFISNAKGLEGIRSLFTKPETGPR